MKSLVDRGHQTIHTERMVRSTDNTEGSLTKEQQQILVGVLLGDGAMRKKTHALLEINHSFKQREYVDWLYEQLKEFVDTPPKMRKTNGNRIAYRFTTKSLPVFTQYYDLFFKNSHKIIPDVFQLSPRSLAVWYMDDGSRCDTDIYLNSQQFSQEEQEKLVTMLQTQFGIVATLNKDKQYKRIRIKKESVSHFMRIITPYIVPTMKYKLLL